MACNSGSSGTGGNYAFLFNTAVDMSPVSNPGVASASGTIADYSGAFNFTTNGFGSYTATVSVTNIVVNLAGNLLTITADASWTDPTHGAVGFSNILCNGNGSPSGCRENYTMQNFFYVNAGPPFYIASAPASANGCASTGDFSYQNLSVNLSC